MTNPSQSLSADAVRQIARLARIALSDDEIAAFTPELARILEWANHLDEVDLSGVAPWQGVGQMDLEASAPRTVSEQSSEKALANAPKVRDGHFSVPRFIE